MNGDSPLNLDAASIAAAVFEKHGIAIGVEDPAFLLVTINELVLDRVVNALKGDIALIFEQTRTDMEEMRTHAAAELGKSVRMSAIAIRREMQSDIDGAKIEAEQLIQNIQRVYSQVNLKRWFAAGIVAGALILGLGILVGYFITKWSVR